MVTRTAAAVLSAILLLGCGSGGTSDGGLRDNVETYSAAYLGNEPEKAIALISARCKERIDLATMGKLTAGAQARYVSARITGYEAKVSGGLARVTYRYTDPAIDQVDQPWAKEGGRWLRDAC